MPHAKDKIFEIDEHISKRFEMQKRLGKGAYGIVWKAIDKKTKEVVAIKKIFDAFRNKTDAQRTFREIVFLQSFKDHPNIIKLHSVHRAVNNGDIYLGFEYMETDLHNVIKRGILKDIHKQYIIYQILKAIKYIHSANVIHRDLKPSNLLLDVNCKCKIADFGLARSLTQVGDGNCSNSHPTLTDYVATRWYRAPEILIANRSYTKGIDMWSIGCILGEMLTGKPLFPGTSTVNQVEKIMATIPTPTAKEINKVCVSGVGSSMIKNACKSDKTPLTALVGRHGHKEATRLLQNLLLFDPEQRLTAKEALDHDYVANFHRLHEEIVMSNEIVMPFNDDIQLSVEDYRNKLYEVMSTDQRFTIRNCSKLMRMPLVYSKVTKSTEKSMKNYTNVIKSEPKINNNQSKPNIHPRIGSDIRSDPKVSKSKISKSNQMFPDWSNKKRISSKNNNFFMSYNNYSRTHGIITQSALLELKTSLR